MSDTPNLKNTFWNFKAYDESEWFKKLAITLISLAAAYALLHLFTDRLYPTMEYEYVKLDKGQLQQVNRIYFDSVYPTIPVGKTKTDTPSKNKPSTSTPQTNIPVTNTNSLDSVAKVDPEKRRLDSLAAMHSKDTAGAKKFDADSCNCAECTKTEKLMCYLWNEFNQKLDPKQMSTINQYISCASPVEAATYLGNARLQVKSYFWLTGPLIYWEIIFWSWFGVLCSLLFNLGVVSKNSTTVPTDPTTYFDSSEIPSQVSKLLYAPACTLAIIFGYNFFTDQNIVDISSSKGVLVFAFIGGFYSSRLISFLDRLKELVLPVSSAAATANNAPALKNIVVQLLINKPLPGLPDLSKIDLSTAKVTLEKDKSSIQNAIPLSKENPQSPLFIFDFIKPDSYTIRASLNTIQDGKTITLEAEQKIEMKSVDQSVILTLTTASNPATALA